MLRQTMYMYKDCTNFFRFFEIKNFNVIQNLMIFLVLSILKRKNQLDFLFKKSEKKICVNNLLN